MCMCAHSIGDMRVQFDYLNNSVHARFLKQVSDGCVRPPQRSRGLESTFI